MSRKKETAPNNQPVKNERMNDAFSRSTAHSSGTSANQAVNHNSKSGNARISRPAARIASKAFFQVGNIRFTKPNVIATF